MLTDDGRTDDGRTTEAGVIGILIAHLGAFGSGELKKCGDNNILDAFIKKRGDNYRVQKCFIML